MGRLRPEWSEKAGGAESPRSLFAESEGLDLPNALKGAPQKRSSAFAGRGGAREQAELLPKAEAELSGLCDNEFGA